MPSIRPFRALRYSPDVVDDLSRVVAPPYDVIHDRRRRELAARDPHNVVRLDLPVEEAGDPPDERYRRAARTLAAWRADGTLRRDPRPSLYAYEQTYRVPGAEVERTRRGVFARVVLEPFAPDSGIRPHERTLSAPKEDRYRLLRATGVNTSPVVGLYADRAGRVGSWLREVAALPPVVDFRDDDDVRHRLWVVSVGEDEARDEVIRSVTDSIGASRITLADGHHRYETALRYADERRLGPALEDEPAWAEILMLLLEPEEGALTVLATHRVLLGLDEDAVDAFLRRLGELFEVRSGSWREELIAEFAPSSGTQPRAGTFGVWTRRGGGILTAKGEAFRSLLPAGGEALRRLDVTLAGVAIEHLAGIDPDGVSGGRLAYTRSAEEAIAWVDASTRPTGDAAASVALLLHATPAAEIVAVAADGDVMPQKSTYIYPKAITGLVINPLE